MPDTKIHIKPYMGDVALCGWNTLRDGGRSQCLPWCDSCDGWKPAEITCIPCKEYFRDIARMMEDLGPSAYE